jgi:broad specificity phosphatase PhoE
VTGVVRLTLVSHAMTDAMAAARFPAAEPLNEIGRRQAEAAAGPDITGLDAGARQFSAPERRAYQTAKLLGLSPRMEGRLADLKYGGWRGKAHEDIPPDELAEWRFDPAAAPHGGESIVELIDRVGGWLDSLTPAVSQDGSRIVAVTHPGVVRAAILLALDASPESFWRIDIAPVSRTVLHSRDGWWTLRL